MLPPLAVATDDAVECFREEYVPAELKTGARSTHRHDERQLEVLSWLVEMSRRCPLKLTLDRLFARPLRERCDPAPRRLTSR